LRKKINTDLQHGDECRDKSRPDDREFDRRRSSLGTAKAGQVSRAQEEMSGEFPDHHKRVRFPTIRFPANRLRVDCCAASDEPIGRAQIPLSLVSIGRKALIFRCPEHRATDKDR
jgi:hypothetical protein